MPDEAPDVIQDQLADEATAPSAEDQAQAADASPETFSDKFDPASLPDELRPAYQQLRADYTRKTQEIGSRNRDQILQQALQDPNFRNQAFEAWGVEYGQDDDDLYEDPDEDLRREVAELRQWRDEITQANTKQQREQALTASVDRQLESLEERIGRELPEKVSNWIGTVALNNPDDTGQPDVQGAYDQWADVVAEERKSWVNTKRKARPAPSGQSGSKQVNLKNDQERLNALAEAFEEAELGE
jgi:hypothetical protein